MKTKTEEFEVLIPNLDATGIGRRVKVQITLEWDEEVQQWLVTPESHELIDRTKARLIGLLLPAQLKKLRERYEYTQKEMGELFQVGEKSWTRWESGKHRPSRSINLLIRGLYEGEISINYLLKRAGKPPMEKPEKYTKPEDAVLSSWLSAITEHCNLEPDLIYPGKTGEQVLVQYKSSTAKNVFLKQILKLVAQQQSQTGHIVTPGNEPMHRRVSWAAPTHTYTQPRLTNTPTEA
jgi:transcriptional regulator with XRE-family HTH domain